MNINRVVVSGNITRDPEVRQAGSTPLLSFGIAVNERRKNQQTDQWEEVPNFFEVTVWGSRGESLSRFLSKGMKVVVSGRLRWSSWQNQEGEKRSKVDIIADDVDFMSSREGSSGGGFGGGEYASSAASSGADAGGGYAPPAGAPSGEALDTDIPF